MLKNTSKKLILIIISVIALIGTVTGATLAYIIDRTPSIENSFDPVYVSCAVEEQFDGVTKSDVKVRNTGDIKAFVRATFIVMWRAEDGSILAKAPVVGTDYSVSMGSEKWQEGSDGFYYYTSQLPAGSATDALIEEITVIGTAPEGCSLSVHVAATAIQSEPVGAVTEAWGATVKSNGTLVAP